ncbi:hypothetical protein HY546_03110 [archaeon]|nr:hypothetical protein [archaeon]
MRILPVVLILAFVLQACVSAGGVKDCGEDERCFVSSAVRCEPAKGMVEVLELPFGTGLLNQPDNSNAQISFQVPLRFYFEVKGGMPSACRIFSRLARVDLPVYFRFGVRGSEVTELKNLADSFYFSFLARTGETRECTLSVDVFNSTSMGAITEQLVMSACVFNKTN